MALDRRRSAALAVGGVVAAYVTLPHVAGRIDRFLAPQSGDTFQIDKALDSILRGGWFGQGPGEGMVKRVLPDAHTDFIFAVAAEEFGIIVCIALVAGLRASSSSAACRAACKERRSVRAACRRPGWSCCSACSR